MPFNSINNSSISTLKRTKESSSFPCGFGKRNFYSLASFKSSNATRPNASAFMWLACLFPLYCEAKIKRTKNFFSHMLIDCYVINRKDEVNLLEWSCTKVQKMLQVFYMLDFNFSEFFEFRTTLREKIRVVQFKKVLFLIGCKVNSRLNIIFVGILARYVYDWS